MPRVLEAHAVVSATAKGFEQVEEKIRRLGRGAQAVNGMSSRMAVLGASADTMGRKLTTVGRKLTTAITLPTVAAGYAVQGTVHDLALAQNKLRAFGDISEAETKRLTDVAARYGAKYAFGPVGVLQGMVEEIKAGFEPRHLDAIQQPLLDFATLAEIDVPKAAELAIFSLAGFGKMYDKTGAMLDASTLNANLREMVDLFAILNKVAPGSIGDISETFKYAAAAAAQLHVSPQQLGAFTAVLAQAGIIGPEAGVALRSMMVRFLKPTRPALAALNAVGMKLSDYVQINPDMLKPEAILSAVENYSGTIGKGKKKRKFTIGRGSDADRARFLAQVRGLDGLSGDDYVKGLTAIIRKTVGGGLADAQVAGDLAQHIVGTAVEKIDVAKFLKDVAAKAPNMAAFMALFMDQRQAVRLANLDNARVTKMLTDMENELTSAREKGSNVSRDMAGKINSGYIEAENRLRGSYQNFIKAIFESGVGDAAAKMMDSMAGLLTKLAEANPKIIEFGTYTLAAAAALGPLTMIIGNLVRIAALVPRGAGALAAGGASGTAAALFSKNPVGPTVSSFGVGLLPWAGAAFSIATTPDVLSKTKGGRAWDDILRERFRAEKQNTGRAVLSLADIQALRDGYAPQKIDGQVDVRVKVEPSENFISRIITRVTGAIFGGAKSATGTSGSTGPSSPDAEPAAP